MCHTRIATLLNALTPVRDASSGVSGVDDVALVASGAVKRLVSIFSGAAGLSWESSPHGTSGVFIKREESSALTHSDLLGLTQKVGQ